MIGILFYNPINSNHTNIMGKVVKENISIRVRKKTEQIRKGQVEKWVRK